MNLGEEGIAGSNSVILISPCLNSRGEETFVKHLVPPGVHMSFHGTPCLLSLQCSLGHKTTINMSCQGVMVLICPNQVKHDVKFSINSL